MSASSDPQLFEAHGGAGGEHERSVAMHEAGRGQVADRVVDTIAGREIVGTVGQLAQELVYGEVRGMNVEQ